MQDGEKGFSSVGWGVFLSRGLNGFHTVEAISDRERSFRQKKTTKIIINKTKSYICSAGQLKVIRLPLSVIQWSVFQLCSMQSSPAGLQKNVRVYFFHIVVDD